jgi:outer membrane protein TolC
MSMILQGPMGSEPTSLVLSPKDEFADLNLMLMVPLWTGATFSAQVTGASASLRAAEATAADIAAEVALEVREAFFEALLGVEQVEAMRARVAAAEAMVEVAKAQLEAGKGIEASVRRAEAELAEAKQGLTMAENERQKMILELAAAMNAPMDPLPRVEGRLSFEPLEGDLAGFLESAKRNRGELIAARRRVEAARAKQRSAQGSQGPQVYGFAMSDTFSPADSMGRRSGYAYGVVASLPLFDSGMRRSEVAAARAMVQQAQAAAQTIEVRVEKEVRQSWLDVATAARNIDTARAALEAAQSNYDVVRVRVEAGKAILVEQLDALSALTRARANVAEAVANHNLAKARLQRAVGIARTRPGGPEK